MATKIKELKELSDLFDAGTITQQEFKKLKQDLLESNSTNNQSLQEKITLESYENSKGETIDAPKISYLNFSDISNSESVTLKSFLKVKYIDSTELSNDEVRILEKLYTPNELSEFNSEKSGFNYPFTSRGSLISLGVAIYFLFQGLGAILLGAGSILILSFIMAVTSLSKGDATKLDKNCAMVSLVGVLFTFFVVYKEFF